MDSPSAVTPALTFALTIDRVLNGLTRPFFGWVSDQIGRERTMMIAFFAEAVGIFALYQYGSDPLAFVILTGIVFFAWGEIYSLFPSTCADTSRGAVAVIFTGTGTRAFCTGGNTAEYAEYYAGRPEEYRQYMRLFNDMVSAILMCDKPVICRVNGMRIAGGQEIGMACDFSIAQDLARFGQAGPKHGSAPIGGATDFLPLMVGAERAMVACVLCEPFSAHQAYRMGILTDVVPALKVDGKFVIILNSDKVLSVDELSMLGQAATSAPVVEAAPLGRIGQIRWIAGDPVNRRSPGIQSRIAVEQSARVWVGRT